MKREFSAGGIVFNKEGKVLITQHSSYHHWSFPKGHIEEGQTSKEAALREVREEGGVEAEIIDKVGTSKYIYVHPETKPARNASQSVAGGEKIFKIVTFYLMEYISGDPKDHDWEVTEAKFVTPDEALKILSFSQDKSHLKKALEMIKERV